MRIVNKPLLKLYRIQAVCPGCDEFRELCAHHAIVRCGLGGGSRIDDEDQCLGVCFVCNNRAEADSKLNKKLQRIAADRAGCSVGQLKRWCQLVLRTPKGQPVPLKPWRARRVPRTPTTNSRNKPSALGDQGRDQTGHSDALPSNAASRPAPRLRKAARDPVDEVETGWVEF